MLNPKWKNLSVSDSIATFFGGRLGRKYYFLLNLWLIGGISLAYIVCFIPFVFFNVEIESKAIEWSYQVFYFFLLPIRLSLDFRRSHDIGIGGHWIIALLFIGWTVFLLGDSFLSTAVTALTPVSFLGLLLWPGNKTQNIYGSVPHHSSLKEAALGHNTANCDTSLEYTPKIGSQTRFLSSRRYWKLAFCISAIVAILFHVWLTQGLEQQAQPTTDAAYLLFPSTTTIQVYRDRELTIPEGTVTHAVYALQHELDEGVIETNLFKDHDCDTTVFLNKESVTPKLPSNVNELVKDLNVLYKNCDAGSQFSLEVAYSDNGQHIIRLTDTLRLYGIKVLQTMYEYSAHNNEIVIGSHEVYSEGILNQLATLTFSVPSFLILLALFWLLRKIIHALI